MSNPMKVVIVGGVAAGPKVAAKVIRLMSDAGLQMREANAQLATCEPR